MRLLTKALIGVAAVGITVAIIDSCTSSNDEKKETENKVVDITEEIAKKEDDTILKKIKRFVKKKVVKFLAWVTLHMEQIEAVGAVLGLAGAAISIAGSVRDFARGDDIQEKLDNIEGLLERHDELERERNNHLGKYVEECTHVVNDNLKTADKDIILLADKMGYKLLEADEVFEF